MRDGEEVEGSVRGGFGGARGGELVADPTFGLFLLFHCLCFVAVSLVSPSLLCLCLHLPDISVCLVRL